MSTLMDIDGLAARLGVTRSWVRNAVSARRIPHTRVGRHVRFSEEHFAAIVAAGETPVADMPTRLASVARIDAVGPKPPQPPPPSPRPVPPPRSEEKREGRAA